MVGEPKDLAAPTRLTDQARRAQRPWLRPCDRGILFAGGGDGTREVQSSRLLM
jgi:hypothetical protein